MCFFKSWTVIQDLENMAARWEEVLNCEGRQSDKRGMGGGKTRQEDNIVFLTGVKTGERTKITHTGRWKEEDAKEGTRDGWMGG